MTKNIRHNGRDLQLRELADDILKGLPADALVASILVNVVIVFINSWMVQMVFTNRYGKSSWTNITFSFIDMAIVLYMSNAFAATFDRHLATFFTAAGLLSLTLCLQYLIVYHQATNHVDRQIVRAFSGILGLQTVTLLIGGTLHQHRGDYRGPGRDHHQLDRPRFHRQVHPAPADYLLPPVGTADRPDHPDVWGNDRRDCRLLHPPPASPSTPC